MRYKLSLEFETPAELADFIKQIAPEQKEEVKVIYDLPTMNALERRKSVAWTEFEDNYIIDHYFTSSARKIAMSFGRTPVAVTARIVHLKKIGKIRGRKNKRNGPTLTYKDEDYDDTNLRHAV